MTIFRKSRADRRSPGSWFLRPRPGSLLFVLMVCTAVPGPSLAMSPGMRGPRQPLETMTAAPPPVPPQAPRQALLAPIRWFQAYVSPTDGPRCQFAPTCSSFGYAALRDHGPWHGILMTADRLLRCSYLTDPRAYPRRLDGRLVDPVVSNLLGP